MALQWIFCPTIHQMNSAIWMNCPIRRRIIIKLQRGTIPTCSEDNSNNCLSVAYSLSSCMFCFPSLKKLVHLSYSIILVLAQVLLICFLQRILSVFLLCFLKLIIYIKLIKWLRRVMQRPSFYRFSTLGAYFSRYLCLGSQFGILLSALFL